MPLIISKRLSKRFKARKEKKTAHVAVAALSAAAAAMTTRTRLSTYPRKFSMTKELN